MARAKMICNHLTVFLQPEDSLREVVNTLSRTRLDAIPVVNEKNEMLGAMTKHNLYRALLDGLSLDTPINKHYSSPAVSVEEEDTFEKVYLTMLSERIGQVVVTNRKGKPVGMVTRFNLIEKLHNRSERMAGELASLLNVLENGVVAINRREIITVFNPAAEKMLGIKAAQVIGTQISDSLPDIRLQNVLETEVMENWRQIANRPGIFARYLPVFRKQNINGAIAVLHDLTEYEQVAQELESVKKLQQTFATVLDLAYDGLIVVNQDGAITTANRAILEFLQAKQEDLVGRPVRSILPELELEEILLTGLQDQGDVRSIQGKKCIVTRFPIVRDNRVLGAVAKLTFRDLHRLPDLVKRLETLENQLSYYRDQLSRVSRTGLCLEDIVGESPAMQRVKSECRLAARSISTVLLLGESGTGKEVFANAIHHESRRPGPFIKVNCAALPENLLESEFFGYEGGAFTGARKGGKPGKFELADGGTLFLDEIGDMSPQLQAKLLRVLQEREFERVGGTKTISVNVRIIAATNRQLEQLIEEGKFRGDLYYRLNVITVHIPPLHQRLEDIPYLAAHFTNKYNQILGARVTGLSPEAEEILMRHHWPGNVRELENVIERALNIVHEGNVLPVHLPGYLQAGPSIDFKTPPIEQGKTDLSTSIASTEKDTIVRALLQAGGNRTKAAKLLGISRTCLYEKLKRYNIHHKQ